MMKSRMLLLAILILTSGFSYAQSEAIEIEAGTRTSVVFCKDTVRFDDGLVVLVGDSVYEGLKISIANFKAGAERLDCPSHSSSISVSWASSNGTLQLSGAATAAEYEAAIANIIYINLDAIPDTVTRQIAVSLLDADFLPETGHFYKFVQQWDIKWTEAKVEAEKQNYRGLQGYLATITSKVENDFIWTKISGVGWIGATDANEYSTEGNWKWVTGPEAGTLFWRGNYNGSAVNGEYSYWSNNEPNNSYIDITGGIGEDYAHITQDPGQPLRSWNDLRDEGDGPYSQYYRPKGYVIEYGGMQGDPELNLSTSFEIKIRKPIFSSVVDQTICKYDSVVLNQVYEGSYSWTPAVGLSKTTVPNPKASPVDTTTYKVIVNYDGCVDSAFYTVNIKPLPVFDLGDDLNLCMGDSAWLDSTPLISDGMETYNWSTGGTEGRIQVGSTGQYAVLVTNSLQCSATDTIDVTTHAYPQISIVDKDMLTCDFRQVQIDGSVDKGSISWTAEAGLNFSDATISNPVVQAVDTGSFQAYLQVADVYGCMSQDTVQLHFYDTPTTELSIDSTTCSGYSLDVKYVGNASDNAVFSWYFPDTLYVEGSNLNQLNIALGYQQTNQRNLGLQINESGCITNLDWTPVRVTPNLDLSVDVTEGCMPLQTKFEAATTESITSYTWDFGDGGGVQSAADNIDHTYTDAGTYDVSLTVVSADGCTNSGTMKDFITVFPIKTIETDIDPSRCYPNEFDVNYTGTGSTADTYHWDLSELDPEEILADPGMTMGPLSVRLSNKPQVTIGLWVESDKGCQSEIQTFSMKRKPWFELDADAVSGCSPLTVNLSAVPVDAVDQLTYSWNTGLKDGVSGQQIAEEYTSQGSQYEVSVVATSTLTGCSDTMKLDQLVEVYTDPIADFEPDRSERLISDALFQFVNQSVSAESYEWNFGDGSTSIESDPEYRYGQVGWFTVNLLVESEYGCIDTISHKVLVAPEDLFPPNALNPNSSNPENRVFLLAADAVQDSGYKMRIFNRWGEQVFESTDKTIGWDGKMGNGNFAPPGVYVWILSFTDVMDKPHQQKGTVTLVF